MKVAMASASAVRQAGVIAWLVFEPKDPEAAVGAFSFGRVIIDELPAQGSQAGAGLSQAVLDGVVNAGLPKAYSLEQNAPNPFNPSTTISYSIPEGQSEVAVKLTVFNLRGQLVKTLVQSHQTAGQYRVQWDGINENSQRVTSGVYLYRLQAGNFTQTRKMVILK